jgi:hypothetical protein
MKTLLVGIFAILLMNCATTTLYHNGQKIASFQGDMKDVDYTTSAKGGMTLKASSIDHSAATLAQGKSASDKISAAGAAIAIS